jgi:hypothetical protein
MSYLRASYHTVYWSIYSILFNKVLGVGMVVLGMEFIASEFTMSEVM